MFFFIILYIKNPYLDLEKILQVAETMFFPDWLIRSFLMNPKYNYSTAPREDARRFEERLNGAGDISSFGTTVRNKRHAGVTCWS